MCKWAQNPDEVEFALSVLERLAKRYGNRKGLFGIQPLNEPITENMWETMDIQNRYAPADQEMAKGSAPITMKFPETVLSGCLRPYQCLYAKR